MNRHGNQVEWALHAAAALAGLPEGKRLSASAMANLFEVPPKYLAKALQAMAGAGLIASTPGPRGGYALARPAADIRLIDVVDAIEGGERLFRCQNIRRNGPCRDISAVHFARPCQLAAAMWRAEEAWRQELASVTLADMKRQFQADAAPIILKALGEWVDRNAS